MFVLGAVSLASSFSMLSLLLLFVSLLMAIAWIRCGREPPINLPPGPMALPVIGNMLEMWMGKLHHNFDRLAKRYGSIARIWKGSDLVIILNDIDTAKEALVKKADFFSDRTVGSGHSGNGSIIYANGKVAIARRRFYQSAMRSLGVGKKSLEHKVNEEARHVLESFDSEGEKPFDPEHIIVNAFANIISTICFGYRFEYSDPKFANLLQSIKKTNQLMGFAHTFLFKWGMIFLMPYFLQRIETIRTFIQDIVKEHKESLDPNHIRDIIDMQLLESEQREKVGEPEVDENNAIFSSSTSWRAIVDLFIAGTETSANTVLWLLQVMALYPDVQMKIQAEIDDVIGNGRPPTMGDSDSMPYTTAVLLEVQRMRPVAPHGVPHVANCETELLGYTVPANTIVYVNIWSILRDERHWRDPDKFDPSRFLSSDGRTIEKPEAFIPFGLGRRVCLGETLAKMELFIFSVNLLQRFSFSLPVGKPRPSLDDGICSILLQPHSFEIVAKKR